MKFTTNHIGSYGGNPATIIELTVENWDGSTLVETVTRLFDDSVEEDLIISLRELADELEEHNQKLKP